VPAERLSMRKIKEVLRLKFELGLANRQIARSCSVNHSTVADYLYRAKVAGLDYWPLPADLDEVGLEARLFPARPGDVRANSCRSGLGGHS
jgi:DNA-binding transcriptional regulator LsrR (DeoR family)